MLFRTSLIAAIVTYSVDAIPAKAQPVKELTDAEDTLQFPQIGVFQTSEGRCTATLVRPNAIVTASHCVHDSTHGKRGVIAGSFVIGYGGPIELSYRTSEFHRVDTCGPCSEDVAVIRLIAPVPLHPMRLGLYEPKAGTVLEMYGYGGCHFEFGTKRRVRYTVGKPTHFLCKGDSGGPHMGSDGAVYFVNSGWLNSADYSAPVWPLAQELNGMLDGWQ